MLYRNATVCVLGLNSEAVEEANFLKEIGAEVTFLAKKAPEGLVEGINVICGTALEVKGDMLGVTGLVYQAGDTKGNESLDCNGVFILRAVIAPENLMVGLELSEGQVVVDAQMRTNISGVFAAGDCTGAPLQIAKAVGEGQRACFSAVAYLDN
jgi:thioredoxin reductase (NADPH)